MEQTVQKEIIGYKNIRIRNISVMTKLRETKNIHICTTAVVFSVDRKAY